MERMHRGPFNALVKAMEAHGQRVKDIRSRVSILRGEIVALMVEEEQEAKRAQEIGNYLQSNSSNDRTKNWLEEAGKAMGGFPPKRKPATTAIVRLWFDGAEQFVARLGGDLNENSLSGIGGTPEQALEKLIHALSEHFGDPKYWEDHKTEQLEEKWMQFLARFPVEYTTLSRLRVDEKS